MLAAMRDRPKDGFARPPEITNATICRLSGLRPTPRCPETMEEVFIAGTEPTNDDDLYRELRLDTRNGLLAGTGCTLTFTMTRVFPVFPPELRTWAKENGYPQPPTEYSPLCGGQGATHAGERWIAIERPHQGDSFRLDPLIPDENENVIFRAQAGFEIQSVDWYVNDKKVATSKRPNFSYSWKPEPGQWTIQARSGELVEQVRIEVEK
jgi:penicillin-binding protein 1C